LSFGVLLSYLIRGDTLVFDRYLWLCRHLPRTRGKETLLDVGCGSGALTLAACARGYDSVGLSWDLENQRKAESRAMRAGLSNSAKFPIFDARDLDKFSPASTFDVIINFENIEHIIDDKKLFGDMCQLLAPGGRLLLTTPNFNYWPMSSDDLGPYQEIEDGRHVRRGYSPAMLRELCELSGMEVERIEYCSGITSQLSTRVFRYLLDRLGLTIAWLVILPLRPLAAMAEVMGFHLRGYSICLVACKPRFSKKSK
jgi:SAM-dependent methyltransferase